MICAKCGHEWKLLRAHVIVVERTAEGCREIVQCPACGFEQTVLRPDMDIGEAD